MNVLSKWRKISECMKMTNTGIHFAMNRFSETEKNVYRMIDTLKNIPVVKTYTDIIKILVDGYYTVGKIDVGPYLSTLTWNNIEGMRLQAGFRTNYQFSKKWVYHVQGAYGFDDEKFKYMVGIQAYSLKTTMDYGFFQSAKRFIQNWY